mmetsp:Transcript_52438/g.113589  ORF Transcript_52438/g.113589 Transcript_52438/m.113589 type:complete len:143 (-) Transcript_52438:72-500(-)|eukprot:CAMPEP_0170607426 /NCGR_PEP_ID=MMETSP0224-20130122/21047_1 /TAXON_ID=285029 /ORGANISM="Togula jolla, Strain CCCM 725" /LENGTH=142 /DNA_ID=CAMNT_0010932589 /DNA_START=97 /DNA_END=525 /DNA_ORIENTATION=-
MAASEKEWKECFDLFDKDKDGKIQDKELGESLRSLGQLLTQKEVTEMLKEAPGGLISWDKFKEFAARKPRQPEKQQASLMQAFQVFDPNGTGAIDMAELQHIVTSLGEKLTAQEFTDICKAAKLPTGGQQQYREIVEKVVNA